MNSVNEERMSFSFSHLSCGTFQKSRNLYNMKTCPVCIKDFSLEDKVYEIGCRHLICDLCMLAHVISRLKRGLPSNCPICRVTWYRDKKEINAWGQVLEQALREEEKEIYVRTIIKYICFSLTGLVGIACLMKYGKNL